MAKIFIENKEYEVDDKQNLLHACLSAGFDVPFFCWHPAMHSIGACRQCAVKVFKDESDTRGRIVMSCVTPVLPGMRVSVEDAEAKAFRENVIEWLMSSHPHDCPVCDEGGECHLQDMTQMTGHVYRRFRFKKRTYRNQYLGPLVNHEMNRCIQCYRCVRFYRGYAGGRDLDVFASRSRVYFGRAADGVLESPFAGNLVEVCPTGVFTDKTYRDHYARKWDLQTAPSVCVHCAVGCNTIPGERYGELRRIRNRYNWDVNGYFLCDRGRFGYEFVNSGLRIRQPFMKTEATAAVSKEEALKAISPMIGRGNRIMAIGSPRASLETNFALRSLSGVEDFYPGFSGPEARLASLIVQAATNGTARMPSLKDVESADAVLVLGEDVTNTAPVLSLAVRKASANGPVAEAAKLGIPFWDDAAIKVATQGKKGPLYVSSPFETALDGAAMRVHYAPPQEIARIGIAVARELDQSLPRVEGLSEEAASFAKEASMALLDAKRPLVVSGSGVASEAVIQAASNIAWALRSQGKDAMLSLVMPECNSLGAALLSTRGLDEALERARGGEFDTLIVAENDLFRRLDAEEAEELLSSFQNIIAIDHIATDTTRAAHVTLPAAAFAESSGTLVNIEGRAQRFFKVFVPNGAGAESWRWISEMIESAGLPRKIGASLDDVTRELSVQVPAFEKIVEAAPSADFRAAGQRIPRQTHRASGRTAVLADRTVFEPRPPDDADSALSFSMEGFQGQPPSPLIPRFWAPRWNSVQSVMKYQEVPGGPLKKGGGPGVRLIEPAAVKAPYFRAVPLPFRARRYGWLIVPMYFVFGSEELSVLSGALSTLKPAPFIGISADDAKRLDVEEGDEMLVRAFGRSLGLSARLVKGLSQGVAALPVLPLVLNMPPHPFWGVLSKAKRKAA